MASFRKKNNKWEFTIEIGKDPITGIRIRNTRGGFKTKKEAEQALAKFSLDIGQGINYGNNILVKDFLEQWLNVLQKDRSYNTMLVYKHLIKNHIIPNLGHFKVKDIRTSHIQSLYNRILDSNISIASANLIINILNFSLKYALKMDIINTLPSPIQRRRKILKKTINVWSEDDLKKFLNAVKDTRIYTAVLILSMTGLRCGEFCGLRWENVDLENAIIHVKEQFTNEHTTVLKTQSSYRSIHIPKTLVSYLKNNKNNNNFVYVNNEKYPYLPTALSTSFTYYMNKYCIDLNIPKISIHGLRHTHATILLNKGENIKVISDRLGHASIQMTMDIYSHVLNEMKNRTAELLEVSLENIL